MRLHMNPGSMHSLRRFVLTLVCFVVSGPTAHSSEVSIPEISSFDMAQQQAVMQSTATTDCPVFKLFNIWNIRVITLKLNINLERFFLGCMVPTKIKNSCEVPKHGMKSDNSIIRKMAGWISRNCGSICRTDSV